MKYIADISSEVDTWCNHSATPEIVITEVNYGILYNWYAIDDPRNICASGWHVPSLDDILQLRDNIGGYLQGGDLKEIGLTYWVGPNVGATNLYGFNGRGSGFRQDVFGNFSQYGQFLEGWLTDIDINPTLGMVWNVQSSFVVLTPISSMATAFQKKYVGLSLRILKDSTSLIHGESGVYKSNDDKYYRTICIQDQEWLADNLCETKYRNGDIIPEVTGNATWVALTTGALCYYNNDYSNL